MNKKTVAVIDVGTLKSKFEIAEFDRNLRPKTLHKDKQLTVLGRDLDKTDGFIIEKSILKTIEALKTFNDAMLKFGVTNHKAVTTEAIRKAKNSAEVLERIKEETGILLEEITQDEEAEIYFRSVSRDFPGQVIATADIGGGSVQVVIGKEDEIFEVHNFKTGTYYLQENFSETHHPTPYELENARQYIRGELKSLSNSKYKPEKLVYGSTNIIDFMKVMGIDLSDSGLKDSSHPFFVSVNELVEPFEKITALNYEDRMPMYPAEPYYMWAADKALMNIFQISDYLDVDTVVPSNNNISTGILLELAQSI